MKRILLSMLWPSLIAKKKNYVLRSVLLITFHGLNSVINFLSNSVMENTKLFYEFPVS